MKVRTEFGVQMLCVVPEKVQCRQQQNLVQHIHSASSSHRPSPDPVSSFFSNALCPLYHMGQPGQHRKLVRLERSNVLFQLENR